MAKIETNMKQKQLKQFECKLPKTAANP